MKREGVIITTFLIEKQKQVKLFQVKIPREAEKIIGVEMSFLWLEGVPPLVPSSTIWQLPMTVNRNILLGELKLQSYEKANVFYAGELAVNQNLDFADFTSQSFIPKIYSHQYQLNEDPVMVSGSTTILQGVYRDKLSEYQATRYRYIVKVYIWVAAKEDQSNL